MPQPVYRYIDRTRGKDKYICLINKMWHSFAKSIIRFYSKQQFGKSIDNHLHLTSFSKKELILGGKI